MTIEEETFYRSLDERDAQTALRNAVNEAARTGTSTHLTNSYIAYSEACETMRSIPDLTINMLRFIFAINKYKRRELW